MADCAADCTPYDAGLDLYEFVVCGVEGCPRTTEEGWSEACGLYRLGLPNDRQRCGASLWVDRYFATLNDGSGGGS